MQVGPSGSKSGISRVVRHTVSSNGKPMSRDMGLGSLLGCDNAKALGEVVPLKSKGTRSHAAR